MPASYLVIGGSGLLGRQIAKQLADRGDSVAVLDLVQRYDDIPFHKGDICDEDSLLSVIEEVSPSCIFHTASPDGLMMESNDAIQWKVNVNGTKAVIAACLKAGVKKLVYTSSSGVVFSGKPLNGVDETYPIPEKSFGSYHESKAVAEKTVLAANGNGGLLTCALRPVTIYGVGDRLVIPTMFGQFQEGKTQFQIGDNSNLVDWVSVRNLADAHLLAADGLDSPLNPEEPVGGQAFFITNGEPWPFWDFPRAVWARLGRHYPGKWDPSRKPFVLPLWFALIVGVIAEFYGWVFRKRVILSRAVVITITTPRWFDISKAKRVLGYVPKVSTSEEINNMVEWYVSKVKSNGKVE